ncbi:MAG: PSD1 and planctomycete cytochrome C domain-containing protein [Pirellulales bacterium]|nr:PSD1 and planctomycete cytochrome C domain-containing protein [Pirellulales bacterium]
MTRYCSYIATIAVSSILGAASVLGAPPESEEFFETHIRPLLAAKCYKCHSAEALSKGKLKGGLQVDTRHGIRKGGESGPAVVPGKPDGGTLLSALRYEELEMPPDAPLAAEQIALIEKWIKHGATDPRDDKPSTTPKAIDFAEGRKHWSYQPVRKPQPPAVKDTSWPNGDIDPFVLAKLEEAGIAPAQAADKRTWIRRVSFGLVGLPPTFEEVQTYINDHSPNAKEKVVDRLLASPHYGERWARHWLDVARYADTRGYIGVGVETRYPYAYTYRDYVVKALNGDKPFDRFIMEQLAADQLDISEDKSELAAMGFLTAGHRFLNRKHLMIDQQIDVISRGLLGLTVACARCHDHKYDAIGASDYYAMYGVLASGTEPGRPPVIGKRQNTPEFRAYVTQRDKLQADLDKYDQDMVAQSTADFRKNTRHYLVRLAASLPGANDKDIPVSIAKAGFRGQGLERWRRYINKARSPNNCEFVAWHALATVPRDGFAAKATELIARWHEENKQQPTAPRVNPHILRALADHPPAHMVDVAIAYAKVFEAIIAKSNDKPERLSDPDEERLRAVLYGADSPCNITKDVVRSFFNTQQREQRKKVANRLEQHEISAAGAPPRAMVLYDQPKPFEPHIFIRGDHKRWGEKVARRWLRVLSNKPEHENFASGSGRLELARAIASKDNPLTARVIVNRVWQHHFGHGLVRTPSDFGTRGERPTHPELLDHLAATFVEDGWSLKRLHRRIVLSATYAQSSVADEQVLTKDPENRLLSRFARQRLEFEPLRDAMLAVAGNLDRKLGGRSVNIFKQPGSTRRSLYAHVKREEIPTLHRAFDVANPNISIARRTDTTVPQQALFFMNSPFVLEQANRLAQRAAKVAEGSADLTFVHALYRLTLARDPSAGELKLSRDFLKHELDESPKQGFSPRAKLAQTLLQTNEFVFVD